ncbi:MAG: M20/M25/M40 family metallo-hydrolase [Clostridia bacterium]|nr:M20/M25/M40 family metallo-hydrolase [Clostridia bacterium]
MDLERFIREVTRKPGVSGYECGVNGYIAEQFKPLVDSVEIDVMQNVIARVGSEGPVVTISAHQDEIGMVVTKIEENGSVRLHRNGGVDPRILPSLEVEIQGRKGPVYGVIGSRPPHVQTPDEQQKAIKFDEIFVDTGYPVEKVRELVRIGDPVVMLAEPQILADGGMACKTMDDRASVAAMLVAAEELKRMNVKAQVCFVASSQEEVGAYGAQTAAYTTDPDFAIAIDVTHGEGPGTGKFQAFPLDKIVIERGPFIHRKLGRKMEAVAKKYRIPFEVCASGGFTGTDTDTMQVVRGGIPMSLLSIPLRYMHTTVETLKLDVIRDAGRLMAMTIAEMAEEWEGFEWF